MAISGVTVVALVLGLHLASYRDTAGDRGAVDLLSRVWLAPAGPSSPVLVDDGASVTRQFSASRARSRLKTFCSAKRSSTICRPRSGPPRGLFRPVEDLRERRRESLRVPARVRPAGLAVDDRLSQAADLGCDHRDSAGKRLERREAQPLLPTRLHADVRGLVEGRELEAWMDGTSRQDVALRPRGPRLAP